jgi:hypothetical protein
MRIKLQNWLNKWFHIVPPLGWEDKYEAQRLLDKLIVPRLRTDSKGRKQPADPDLPECSCYDCNKKELQEIASGKRRIP